MVHFIHLHARPGGIEVLLPKIIEHMPGHNFQAFVARPLKEGQANVYQGHDIPVAYGGFKNWFAFWRLWKYARKYREDLFQVFNIGPINLLTLYLAGAKKVVYSVHGTVYWNRAWKKYLLKAFWKLALSRGCRVIANSRHSRDCFKRATGFRGEITVVYNPFSPDYFKPREEARASKLRVIYSGRLAPGKNLFRWIKLATAIHRQNPEAEFYLYGEGPLMEALQKQAGKSGIREAFHFMGHNGNMAEAYQSASILIFLSQYESFGNVAVESILCGTPVLASDIPSMREIFENYPEFIISVDDKLEDHILSKITCLPKLKASALKAREEFKARFGVKQHIGALKKIYAQLD